MRVRDQDVTDGSGGRLDERADVLLIGRAGIDHGPIFARSDEITVGAGPGHHPRIARGEAPEMARQAYGNTGLNAVVARRAWRGALLPGHILMLARRAGSAPEAARAQRASVTEAARARATGAAAAARGCTCGLACGRARVDETGRDQFLDRRGRVGLPRGNPGPLAKLTPGREPLGHVVPD